jgi:hypothetical protein
MAFMGELFDKAKKVAEMKARGIQVAERMKQGEPGAEFEFLVIHAPAIQDPELGQILLRTLIAENEQLQKLEEELLETESRLQALEEKVSSGEKLTSKELRLLRKTTAKIKRITKSLESED